MVENLSNSRSEYYLIKKKKKKELGAVVYLLDGYKSVVDDVLSNLITSQRDLDTLMIKRFDYSQRDLETTMIKIEVIGLIFLGSIIEKLIKF